MDSGCHRSGSEGRLAIQKRHRRVGEFAIRGVWIPASKPELRRGGDGRGGKGGRAHRNCARIGV